MAYLFYLLTRQENEVDLAIKAVEKVMLRLGISGPDDFKEMEANYPNKDFIQKYYLEFYHKWKTADREIEDFVWNTIGDKKFDYTNEFFRNINHEDIKKFLDLNEHIYSQTILFFIEYNNIIDKQKNNLREKILTTTKKSTNAILYAFLLQLIIFCIIQFFELREISREKKNIK